jgi:hypothetical protein
VPHLWPYYTLARFGPRNRAGMEATLERLARMVSAGP